MSDLFDFLLMPTELTPSLIFSSISLPSSIPFAIKAVGPEGGKVVVDIPGMDKFDKGGRDDVELIYAGGYNLGTVRFSFFGLYSGIQF